MQYQFEVSFVDIFILLVFLSTLGTYMNSEYVWVSLPTKVSFYYRLRIWEMAQLDINVIT